MNTRPRLLTGVDLPAAPSCGSMILCGDLYQALDQRFQTTFLTLPSVDPAWAHGFDRLLTCHARKQPYGPDFTGYVAELTAEVRGHLAAQPADLIHAQHLGFGLSLAFVRASGTLPVISLAHGTDVIAAEQSLQAQAALTEVVAASHSVVIPTSALRQRIDALTGHRFTARLTVLPWGIPTNRCTHQNRPPTSRPAALRVVYAGRLDANKSAITAIEALPLTRYAHDLTVIGSGSELGALTGAAHRLGLTDRVRFEPFLPRGTLWSRLQDFDAFVFTTADLEAFGLVAVEAQAHGVPIVYSDLPGMTDTLGGAGLPYAPRDAGHLAAQLDALAADPVLRDELSGAGIANAQRYDIRHTADHLAHLSQQAIDSAAT